LGEGSGRCSGVVDAAQVGSRGGTAPGPVRQDLTEVLATPGASARLTLA